MRIVLVGQARDRDRLRPELVHAGFEIVAEAVVRPSSEGIGDDVDAIVDATPDGQRAVLPEPLTAREQDVLAHLSEGLSNKAIAEALGISDQTVKFHVAAIIGKLGAANRTDAVRRAIRKGLVAI